jgi:hypothetical protein
VASPYSLAFCPAPDTLADGFPQATRPPLARSPGFSCPGFRYHTVLRLLTGPWCPLRLSAYRRTFPARSLRDRPPMRSPGVTSCSSAPCRPHTPWSEGRMDHAFVAIVPTRPDPLFGRPVHRRGRPHRLRPGASPQALRIPPRGGHPALPGRHDRGQRGITPAFGYGALHPSARRTLTSRSTPLPGAHYRPIRLPPVAHCPSGSPRSQRPRHLPAATVGSPGFRTLPVPACRRLRPRWTRVRARLSARPLLPSPPLHTGRRPR